LFGRARGLHPSSMTSFRTATDLISEAKARITEVSASEVQEMQDRGDAVVYLDVREQNEWNLGHLPRATFIPRGILESNIEQRVPRDSRVVVYCASGNRSALAADTLKQMGYANVSSMAGGIRAWVDLGGVVEG
jgi:sulfur-carrier protein adenylyltransferase/sulfurtransferase